ncbi:hypothetical protein PENTCL1PPCAC_26110 [Pristionchus entomophagus]|uniref:Decapping nuclease n=1 Tax=Pristionchus entomophagus TaxID=358040 RepID=A0AAV5UBU7_9BILA|nr:hypothetical protein PENTCL1PPCAC_26110 [Pristionchus entomophagus]
MTTVSPNGTADSDSPVDNRPIFEMMVRSDLVVGEETIKLCCGAEVDALREDEPIELKTAAQGNDSGFLRNMRIVMQSEIVGERNIGAGMKGKWKTDEQYIVHEVIEKKVEEIKATGDISKNVAMCYSFLFTVLSKVKHFLEENEACEVKFDPFKEEVLIKKISREEAKENGNGVTNQFLYLISRLG